MAISIVGTTLDRVGGATHSGFVDMMDSQHGVRGWAVNLVDPSEPVSLELCMGSGVVAVTQADTERADISAKLGRTALSAFQFDAEAMRSLPDFLDDPSDVLTVRIAATGHHLSNGEPAPSAGEILARIKAEQTPVKRNITGDFEELLGELQAGARALAEQALRPVPANLQGYIETVATSSASQVWFMGWMKRGHLQEFSAVLVDRIKYPAAVAVISYQRDDLPSDACGVVGLISSHWRPNSASTDVHLYFGAGGRFHLRSHAPMRLLPSHELINEYEGIRDRISDGRTTAIQSMLDAADSWRPTHSPAQWFATETSVDRALLVPGLGCFIEGWVLSPIKRIESLRLRVGATVMFAGADSLYWKARLDLLGAFPACEHMVHRAGFVGLFAGDAEPEDFADPMLKLTFEGGGSANSSIASKVFRRLGHSATVEDALLFFPALQDEVFFPRFAEAAIRAERGATRLPVPISVTPSRRCLIFVLPQDRCDMFLFFEELAHQCRVGGSLEALAFIASASANRSDALWLFREFQTTHGTPRGITCSLMVVDHASQAFGLLPDILSELGAQRFLFASSGVFLTEFGWERAREAMAQAATSLEFFGFERESHERRSASLDASARCFAWSSAAFTRWSLAAPAFMGGFFKDNALRSKTGQILHADAARSTRKPAPTRTEEAVNAAVYERAGESGQRALASGGESGQRALA